MKKQNLLKLAFTMMAMVIITGAMAQLTTPGEITHTGDPATYETATTTTYQTVGVSLRLYVEPDVVYSPSYTGTGVAGAGLNTNSLWRWVSGPAYTVGVPADEVKAAANQNWVDIASPVAGATTYWVLESNSLITCPGTATSHVVYGVTAPTADIAGQGNSWDAITAGTNFRRCASGADIGDVITVSITETGAPALAELYTYGISVEQQALDASLVPTGGINDVTGTYGVAAAPGSLVAAANHIIPALPLLGASTPTQYRFTLTANSIFSNISIRSQLRAGIAVPTGYTGAATTITYNLLPVPTTGPIFHIPNKI